MNNDYPGQIAQKVLAKIRGGNVHMRPRAYFIVRVALTAFLALLTLAVSVWVISFVMFSIDASGELFLLGFGTRGIAVFLGLFPWFSLIVDLALLFMLELLLQEFKFGYRISLLNIFLGILALSLLLGSIINVLPIHATLLKRADEDRLPLFREMYEGIRDSHQKQGVLRGTIVSMQDSQFVIAHDDRDHDADDGTHTIVMQPGASPNVPLHIGERVYVLGTEIHGVVQAYGIRELSPEQ